ncbi:hypothetical protein [Micromonospora sp. NPDC049301]|uniref:hypothetical protein n=1 Tax=Micromonospora sp. NPDC049301 TaxID=3155723 RepID=UPI0034461D28
MASDDREALLYGAAQMARDEGRNGASTTYVIPADQADFPTVTKLVDKLRWNNIRVERAVKPFTVGDRRYPAGSYLVREAQPYRAAVLDLLNPQVYPDRRLYPGGPLEPPYDITGYTLSFQMGVTVNKLNQAVRAETVAVDWPTVPTGAVAGAPKYAYGLDPRVNEGAEGVTVATWPKTKLLKSGFLLGEDVIGGKAAVVTAKVGDGQVVMIGFKPQHRAQSHGTYKLLFNAMYLGGHR